VVVGKRDGNEKKDGMRKAYAVRKDGRVVVPHLSEILGSAPGLI